MDGPARSSRVVRIGFGMVDIPVQQRLLKFVEETP